VEGVTFHGCGGRFFVYLGGSGGFEVKRVPNSSDIWLKGGYGGFV